MQNLEINKNLKMSKMVRINFRNIFTLQTPISFDSFWRLTTLKQKLTELLSKIIIFFAKTFTP